MIAAIAPFCRVFPIPEDIISERVPDRPAVRDDAVTIALAARRTGCSSHSQV